MLKYKAFPSSTSYRYAALSIGTGLSQPVNVMACPRNSQRKTQRTDLADELVALLAVLVEPGAVLGTHLDAVVVAWRCVWLIFTPWLEVEGA